MAHFRVQGRDIAPEPLVRLVQIIFHHPDAVEDIRESSPGLYDCTYHVTILGMSLRLVIARRGQTTHVFVQRTERDGNREWRKWRFAMTMYSDNAGGQGRAISFPYDLLQARKAHLMDEEQFFFHNNPTDVDLLERDLAAILMTED